MNGTCSITPDLHEQCRQPDWRPAARQPPPAEWAAMFGPARPVSAGEGCPCYGTGTVRGPGGGLEWCCNPSTCSLCNG